MAEQRMSRRVIASLALSVVLCLFALFMLREINWALGKFRKYIREPEKITYLGDTRTTHQDFMIATFFTKESIGVLRYELMVKEPATLWCWFYIFLAVTGGSVGFWLLLFRAKANPSDFDPIAALLLGNLLAGGAGALSYLFMKFHISDSSLTLHDPMDAWMFLPFSVGIFPTVFFDRVPDIINRAVDFLVGKKKEIPAFLIVACVAINAYASGVYYKCIKPVHVSCVALTDEEKKKCKTCREWEPISVNTESRIPANEFVSGATTELFGTALPEDSSGQTITTSELYRNYKKYGWKKLEKPLPGSVAVWPGNGGIVVSTERNNVSILYESKKSGGITTDLLKDVAEGKEARFLLPPKAEPDRKDE